MSEAGAVAVGVDSANAAFWNEMCGSQLARSLGVTGNTPEDLKRFDDWYFKLYPYLLGRHVPIADLRDRDVLEIGLGYGSLSQKIAEGGAHYTGLDIAAGPVGLVNHRLRQNRLPGAARQGSILEAPFDDATFDRVVAIGCLHHTGDLARAISECHRVLRPGGRLSLMVYYAYSYKRFIEARADSLDYLRRERGGFRGVIGRSSARHRASYDVNLEGEAAPHTDWISKRSLAALCSQFATFECRTENSTLGPLERLVPRSIQLVMPHARYFGLDLYASAYKSGAASSISK